MAAMGVTGQAKAFENFMKTTGFAGTNTVPQAAPNPPLSGGTTTQTFAGHYDKSNPRQAPMVPGQMGPVSGTSQGMVTPNNGMVPGHLPPNKRINPAITSQVDALTDANLLGNEPFTAPKAMGGAQDWRAVSVGPESDPRSPGHTAQSMKMQGKLMPTFTGPIEKLPKQPDGPFPEVTHTKSDGPKDSTTVLSHAEKKPVTGPKNALVQKAEKMLGENPQLGAYTFGVATLVSVIFWMNYGGPWAIATLVFASIGVYCLVKSKKSSNTEKNTASNDPNTYTSRHTQRPWDTSRKQNFHPYKEGQPDFIPYPKPDDAQTDLKTRLEAQGLDQSNVEGPRADYWYKRGPTPANRERIKTKDLMRSASMVNMDEREFDEYMARLEGEAPDQFYQAHPYMSTSAFWDHRQQINDMDAIHGVSTSPGTYNRKWAYKDPRIQQAGAKTMHLKEPPPGYGEAIGSKVHPWLEPASKQVGLPFDTDDYIEHLQAHGVSMVEGSKVTSADAGRIATSRQAEDDYYRSLYGKPPVNPDDLPPELEPIRTSREGMGEQLAERKQQWAMQIANEQDRSINYMKNAQGYGYTVLPPHPAAPRPPPPRNYRTAQAPPYPVRYAPPGQMPAPNLRQRPVRDMVATNDTASGRGPRQPKNEEEAAQMEFEGAFKTTTPDEETVQRLLKDVGKR